jgi:hypothetical protein
MTQQLGDSKPTREKREAAGITRNKMDDEPGDFGVKAIPTA